MSSCRFRLCGYTLLELSAVLALIIVLAGVTLPALGEAVRRQRARLVRQQLHAALSMARLTAVSRRQLIGVCPSEDGRTCSQDWSRGWLIYTAHRAGGPPATTASILRSDLYAPAAGLHARIARGRKQLFFHPSGFSEGALMTITFCLDGTQEGQIIINRGGRARAKSIRKPKPC